MTSSCVQTELNLNFKDFLKQRIWFSWSKLMLGMTLFLTSTSNRSVQNLLLSLQLSIEILEKYFYHKLDNTEILPSSFYCTLFSLEMLTTLTLIF